MPGLFWAKDEIASAASAAMYLTALRMLRSRANSSFFVTFASFVVLGISTSLNHGGHEGSQRNASRKYFVDKNIERRYAKGEAV